MYELPIETGARLIETATERERDERLHRQWCAQLPFMTQETFVSFSGYKDRCTGRDIDTRPASEILREAAEIEEGFAAANKEAGDGTQGEH